MREYHLYLFDPGRQVKARIDLSCEDGEAALAQSRARMSEGDGFELWQGIQRLHPARVFLMADRRAARAAAP